MKMTDSHEWIRKEGEGNRARVGLSKKAVDQLGEIVFIELPKTGQELKKGDVGAVLESTKAASDTYVPLNGKVVAINEKLLANPELITKDPHEEGWLYEIELADPADYDSL